MIFHKVELLVSLHQLQACLYMYPQFMVITSSDEVDISTLRVDDVAEPIAAFMRYNQPDCCVRHIIGGWSASVCVGTEDGRAKKTPLKIINQTGVTLKINRPIRQLNRFTQRVEVRAIDLLRTLK